MGGQSPSDTVEHLNHRAVDEDLEPQGSPYMLLLAADTRSQQELLATGQDLQKRAASRVESLRYECHGLLINHRLTWTLQYPHTQLGHHALEPRQQTDLLLGGFAVGDILIDAIHSGGVPVVVERHLCSLSDPSRIIANDAVVHFKRTRLQRGPLTPDRQPDDHPGGSR